MMHRPVAGQSVLRFSCTKRRGAALLTKYRTTIEFARSRLQLEAHMLSNWKSWLSFSQANGYPARLQDLLLVWQCMLTGDWANIAWDTVESEAGIDFHVQIPGVVDTGLNLWGSWGNEISAPAHSGPCRDSQIAQGVEPALDQCIFLKYIRLVPRDWYNRLSAKIKAYLSGGVQEKHDGSTTTVTTSSSSQSPHYRTEIMREENISSTVSLII